MADDDEQKSVALSYVVVSDDENHENHNIMCDMSTPKWTTPHPLGLAAGVAMG